METVSLLKDKPILPTPPQELPVDLTTRNNLPQQNLLNHLIPKMSNDAYPHLRFHKSVIKETDNMKENASQSKAISREDCSFLPKERKSGSFLPKKRRLEEESDYYTSVKKMRGEQLQPPIPTSVAQHYFKENVERGKEFLPNVHSGQYFDQTHVLDHAAILDRMQSHPISGSPESIKETEALMAAVQHSQMLYYSYCTQLLQSLQAQRVLNEREQRTKTSRSNHSTPRVNTERGSGKTLHNYNKFESKQDVAKTERLSPTSSGSIALKISSTPVSSPTSSVDSLQSPTGHPVGNEREDKVTSTAEKKLSSGRKRVPRALTGKHVRPGTGASLTTLMSLRQKLNQRQKMRQEGNNPEKHVENFVRQDRSPCWRRR